MEVYYIITGGGIQKIEEKNFWDSNNGLSKIKGGRDITFAIYITNKRIIILDDDGEAKDAASKIAAGPQHRSYSPARFIYDFLMLFIDGDLLFLEKIERDIAVIEEDVHD